MEAKAEDSLYVGDVYSVDYLGATGVGMQGILMDVSGAYRGTTRTCRVSEELAQRLV